MTTQPEFLDRIRGQFAALAPGADAFIFPNNFSIMSTVIAGEFWKLRGEDNSAVEAAMPDSAEGEFLERWIAIVGVQRYFATSAKGNIQIIANANSVVLAGTVFTRSDGVRFVSDADVTVPASGTVPVAVTSENKSSGLNVARGAPMFSDVSGIGFVSGTSSGLIGGLDAESNEQLRIRLIEAFRNRVNFGSLCGYEFRVKQCLPGVTRAWASLLSGTIIVYYMMDNSYDDGIALPADTAALQSCLDDPCVKIINQTVIAAIPEPRVMNVTVQHTGPAISSTEGDQLIAELDDFVLNNAAPGKLFDAITIQNVLAALRPDINIVLTNGPFNTNSNEIFVSSSIVFTAV